MLWTDYFKPNHFEKHPQLHGLFNAATKQAGAAGGKARSTRPRPKLLDQIENFEDLLGDQAGLSNVDLEAVRPSRAAFRGVADDGNDAVHGCRPQGSGRCTV